MSSGRSLNKIIPFVDLRAQYRSIKDEIDSAINECISESDFIRGKAVFAFEEQFSRYLGSDHCVSCGNGTDALEIILAALGIGPGDEVIVPSLTWIATAEAVKNVKAEPVFADINPGTFTIDHDKLENRITKRTRAIIPVHLYGNPADLNEIKLIAEKHRLFVIEDCAQAHGAEYFGKKVGTFGIAAAFSFFPSKNLGAFGDGGAIVTNNADLAGMARKISNHGQLKNKHEHFLSGRNSRLDTIQAAVLSVKLKYLDEWNNKRIENAHVYQSCLAGITHLHLPLIQKGRKHVYHLFVIRSASREKLINILGKEGIPWGIHYPKPLPLLPPFINNVSDLQGYKNALAVTGEILSLPLYPEIEQDLIQKICKIIIENVS